MNYDIKSILRKFWFVILVGVLFISFAIYFAWDTNKDKIAGKSVNGKDVIFSLADSNYTADTYYKKLYNTDNSDGTAKQGVAAAYTLLEKSVVEQAVKSTDSLESKASKLADQYKQYYQEQYGDDDYESTMSTQLKALGYESADDLEDYCLDTLKREKLIKQYIKKHLSLFDKVYEEKSPRVLAHILVKCSDPDNPTDAEKAKMDKIKKALAAGTSFSTVAKKYSDDTSTASNGGSLGVQYKGGDLEESFQTTAWNLADGETASEWVKTSYGYSLIKVITTDKTKMLKNSDYFSTVESGITDYYTNLDKQIVWKKAKSLGLTINDKTLKKKLMKYIDVTK